MIATIVTHVFLVPKVDRFARSVFERSALVRLGTVKSVGLFIEARRILGDLYGFSRPSTRHHPIAHEMNCRAVNHVPKLDPLTIRNFLASDVPWLDLLSQLSAYELVIRAHEPSFD
jgi:hypothetical protein